MKTYVYDVWFTGDQSAGLNPYSDTVTLTLESGDPGGEPDAWESYMRQAIAEWFDGAGVELLPSAPSFDLHGDSYAGPMCPRCGSDYPRRFWLFGRRRCINQDCREKKIPDIACDVTGQPDVLRSELLRKVEEKLATLRTDYNCLKGDFATEQHETGRLQNRIEELEANTEKLQKSQKAPRAKKDSAGTRAAQDRLNKTEAVVTAGLKLETELIRCFPKIPADLSGPWMKFRAKLREVEK